VDPPRKPGSSELLLMQLRRLDEAGAALLAQAIAVAAGGMGAQLMSNSSAARGHGLSMSSALTSRNLERCRAHRVCASLDFEISWTGPRRLFSRVS